MNLLTKSYKNHRNLILYIIIGFSGLFVEIIISYITYNLMGINDYISNTAGMIGGMLNNYIWNYLVNFKPNSRFLKRFLPYLLIWLFNLGLSNFILFGFNRNLLGITQLTINIAKLPNIGFLASFVEENIFWMAKAIGIAVKVMIGYFLNKKITFQ